MVTDVLAAWDMDSATSWHGILLVDVLECCPIKTSVSAEICDPCATVWCFVWHVTGLLNKEAFIKNPLNIHFSLNLFLGSMLAHMCF